MGFEIQIAGTGYRFTCEPNEALLDAAQRAGLELPYSCKKGICGNCRGRLSQGNVEMRGATQGLTESERAAGFVLYCRAHPLTNVVLDPVEVKRAQPGMRKTISARVLSLMKATDDVTVMQLRFPAGVRAKFRAGQYLHVLFGDGERRSFSLANAPGTNDGALLHIRHVEHGRFTGKVLPYLAVGEQLTVELPFGDFYLREDSDKPIVFLAGGTGFAPIQSIIEHVLAKNIARPMSLYWGSREESGLYARDRVAKWQQRRPDLRFVPVLSDPAPQGAWLGRTGFVHEAVMEDYPSLAHVQVYACGAPAMTRAARDDFTVRRQLPEAQFFSDAFVPGPAAAPPVEAAGSGRPRAAGTRCDQGDSA
jgi:NAD(P)H-flavin reductase/ferredoxin